MWATEELIELLTFLIIVIMARARWTTEDVQSDSNLLTARSVSQVSKLSWAGIMVIDESAPWILSFPIFVRAFSVVHNPVFITSYDDSR